jgi:UDP-galactopyranose mutase
MFENMLDHPNITISLKTDYRDVMKKVRYGELIYSGPVDEFFDYRFGPLPYRSLQFLHETVDRERFQPAPVVNYPNEHDYTRITEFKQLTGQVHARTSVVYEYPCNGGEPYYPVPRPENAVLYKKYEAMGNATPGVHFVGRLGTYKYYNMDQVVGQALALCSKLSGAKRQELVRKPVERAAPSVGELTSAAR